MERVLSRLVETSRKLGERYSPYAREAKELASKLETGEFTLAVLGQFKRGKSSLLNALMGMDILPTSVVPLTAIPTRLRGSPAHGVTVTFLDGKSKEHACEDAAQLSEIIEQFGTEQGNPANRLGVKSIEVRVPSPLLMNGITFVDTPGIGSTFRHNTEATMDFLPTTDGALFVVSSDPPMTETELGFLRTIATMVPSVTFVHTKSDRLDPKELRQSLEFLRQTVADAGFDDPTVFVVSSKKDHPTGQEGIERLREFLVEFAKGSKDRVLREALAIKVRRLRDSMLATLELEERSLVMPLDELKEKSALFEGHVRELEHERLVMHDLMEGDRRRSLEWLDRRAAEVRERIVQDFVSKIFNEIKGLHINKREEEARRILAGMVPETFDRLSDSLTSEVSEHVAGVLDSHTRRLRSLIHDVSRAISEIMGIQIELPEPEHAFEPISRPYWATTKWSSAVYPMPDRLMERLLPESMRARRIEARIRDHVEAVVLKNVEQLRWALHQAVNKAFWAFGSLLDSSVTQAVYATHGAIQHTIDQRRAMEDQSHRLAEVRQAIEALRGLPIP